MTDPYKKLARHLDKLPEGYPETETGIELRILKRLFTVEEAKLAVGLTMMPEPVDKIAKRLQMTPDVLGPVLAAMSKKGLIFRISKTGNPLYMAAQFVVGIWEYHVNDLDEGLINDFNEYAPYLMNKMWHTHKTKQLRVIPVSSKISGGATIMPYEEAEQIIKNQSKIVVAPCICRTEHKMVGKGCDNPIGVCLSFGTGAYYYEENGLGKSISREKALETLQKGIAAGLVLQPGNSKKPQNICMCCGCCCQVLKNLNKMDKPAMAVNSNWFARVDEESCTACEVCVERCHMNAIEIDDVARVNTDRCIGCGVCVSGCEFEAISLMDKDASEKWVPPENVVETYIHIARERKLF